MIDYFRMLYSYNHTRYARCHPVGSAVRKCRRLYMDTDNLARLAFHGTYSLLIK